ncbi:unnamed protein product [Didymodactylos carnosus]|uniref:Uncharacterized protein n=2 Tax=Didymodactylos carnosus TaxID=1234261 RepID=A0A8S2D1W8_9BILA|nr:unnamed protein product [Didymodactylos carnosus]CAF3642312.1 unnamed protein product [Didymodactylos carnosus]
MAHSTKRRSISNDHEKENKKKLSTDDSGTEVLNSADLHQYRTQIDEYLEKIRIEVSKSLILKLVAITDLILKKLSRYYEGSFLLQFYR